MKRPRLVPSSGVEVFQVRIAYWYDEEGKPQTTVIVDETAHEPSLIEILGTIERGKSQIIDMYEFE